MKIAVIIPSFNRKLILKNLLLQINSQSKRIPFEVIIIPVIDGSNDGTIEMLRTEFKDAETVIGNGNWWFTKCLNEGIKIASLKKVEYVLTLNDDVILEDTFFEKLIAYVKSSPKNEVIGAVSYSLADKERITSPGVKKILWWRAKLVTYYAHLEKIAKNPPKGMASSEVLPTRGLLIPMEILKKVNYFDEKFPQYFSDYDFCLRIKKIGIRILINYDLCLYTMDNLTTKTTSTQSSISTYFKSLFDPHSRTYLPHVLRYYWRHGSRLVFPFTILLIYSLNFAKIIKNRFIPLPSLNNA